MNLTTATLIEEAIEAVALAILAHKSGTQAPLSITMLLNIQEELKNMRKYLAPKSYVPSYQRFVIDWPDEKGLVRNLINVAYRYNKLRN